MDKQGYKSITISLWVRSVVAFKGTTGVMAPLKHFGIFIGKLLKLT